MLAEDETDLMMFPPLRAVWSRKGEPAEVHISGRNARRVIFGTMNLMTGTRLFLPRPKGRPATFRRSSRKSEATTGAGTWPCCSTATPAIGEGIGAGGRGDDVAVAAEAVAELNPMDTLWGQGKDVIAANKQYATIDEQVDRFLSL
ncbi:MAG: hypothetical protein U0835_27410 [Isosphaeraceae bacterium]